MNNKLIHYLHPAIDVVTGLRNLAEKIECGDHARPRYVTVVTSDEDVFTFGPASREGDRMSTIAEVIFDLGRAQYFLHKILDENSKVA